MHLFLSESVDPRDIEFPDDSSVDLGPILSPYGAQRYAVPTTDPPQRYRTAVLWDMKLERLYGFAQLSE